MLGASNLQTGITIGGRFADTIEDRPRWRFTLDWRPKFYNPLVLGLEYNHVVREIGPRVTWEPVAEGRYLPKVALGTSSDRIGSPEGAQCYYVTFGKAIPQIPVAPYVSVNYSEWEDGVNFPFGANIQLHRRWSLLPMNDGRKPHLIANYAGNQFSISALWIWFERAGVGLTVGF